MVELIPKKQEREIPFKNVFFFVSGILLLAAVLTYVFLVRLEVRDSAVMQGLEDGIAKVGTKEDRKIEADVFDAEIKIKNFEELFAGRRQSSNFFDNFARLIHPRVWFSNISLDVPQMQVSVSGQSADFEALEQQLIFLRKQSDLIETADLASLAIGEEGGADFEINFIFKPEIFNSTSVSAFIKK